jgi:hypothetical protein
VFLFPVNLDLRFWMKKKRMGPRSAFMGVQGELRSLLFCQILGYLAGIMALLYWTDAPALCFILRYCIILSNILDFPLSTALFQAWRRVRLSWRIFNLSPFGLPSLDYPELCSGPAISEVFWPVPGRGMVHWTACIFLCLSVPHRTPRSSTMVSVAAYPNTAR